MYVIFMLLKTWLVHTLMLQIQFNQIMDQVLIPISMHSYAMLHSSLATVVIPAPRYVLIVCVCTNSCVVQLSLNELVLLYPVKFYFPSFTVSLLI